MTYKEIREAMKREKTSHQNEKMTVVNHGRFSVMKSDKTDAIIVDNDIALLVKNRKWCMDGHGYPVANVKGGQIRLFDFVMAQKFEEKPPGCYVDHINQDKLDNRIINLRFVTPQESSHNMPLKANNTSGVTGVCKTKSGTFRAYITINKERIELGYYKTIGEAIQARREAENRLNFKTRPQTVKDKILSVVTL